MRSAVSYWFWTVARKFQAIAEDWMWALDTLLTVFYELFVQNVHKMENMCDSDNKQLNKLEYREFSTRRN